MNSSSPITCMECGHYPVSSAAKRCPSCGKEKPAGVECQICHELVAYSAAEPRSSDFYYEEEYVFKWQKWSSIHSRWERDEEFWAYDDVLQRERDRNLGKLFYYHKSCLEEAQRVSYHCKICGFLITNTATSCPKCADPIELIHCSYCSQEIIKGKEVKAGFLGQGAFHEYCASFKGGNNWREAWEAEKIAKLEEERKQLEEEKRQQEKDRQQQEEERRKREEAERIRLERVAQAELEREKNRQRMLAQQEWEKKPYVKIYRFFERRPNLSRFLLRVATIIISTLIINFWARNIAMDSGISDWGRVVRYLGLIILHSGVCVFASAQGLIGCSGILYLFIAFSFIPISQHLFVTLYSWIACGIAIVSLANDTP